ncbi:Zinc finger E-box-binding homeobox 1, partial [Stegodyphus mimosarum]
MHWNDFEGNRNSPKRYQCEFCSYSSYSSSNCRRHKVVHSEEHPFNCDICKKTFKHKTSLLNHMYMHSLNPFRCDQCLRDFANKFNLMRH